MSQLESKAAADHKQALDNVRIAQAVQLALKEENENQNKTLLSQQTANQHAINQQHLAEMQAKKALMDRDLAHDSMVKAESSAKAA